MVRAYVDDRKLQEMSCHTVAEKGVGMTAALEISMNYS
jgi:hypothetical protein